MAFLPKSLLNTVDSVSPIANLKRRDQEKEAVNNSSQCYDNSDFP